MRLQVPSMFGTAPAGSALPGSLASLGGARGSRLGSGGGGSAGDGSRNSAALGAAGGGAAAAAQGGAGGGAGAIAAGSVRGGAGGRAAEGGGEGGAGAGAAAGAGVGNARRVPASPAADRLREFLVSKGFDAAFDSLSGYTPETLPFVESDDYNELVEAARSRHDKAAMAALRGVKSLFHGAGAATPGH